MQNDKPNELTTKEKSAFTHTRKKSKKRKAPSDRPSETSGIPMADRPDNYDDMPPLVRPPVFPLSGIPPRLETTPPSAPFPAFYPVEMFPLMTVPFIKAESLFPLQLPNDASEFLQAIVSGKHIQVWNQYKKEKSTINKKYSDGRTALHWAIIGAAIAGPNVNTDRNYYEIIKILVQANQGNANPTIQDNEDCTAEDLLTQYGPKHVKDFRKISTSLQTSRERHEGVEQRPASYSSSSSSSSSILQPTQSDTKRNAAHTIPHHHLFPVLPVFFTPTTLPPFWFPALWQTTLTTPINQYQLPGTLKTEWGFNTQAMFRPPSSSTPGLTTPTTVMKQEEQQQPRSSRLFPPVTNIPMVKQETTTVVKSESDTISTTNISLGNSNMR